jgi:hypothetical protein
MHCLQDIKSQVGEGNTTVLAFPILRADLVEAIGERMMTLNGKDWQQVLRRCRTTKQIENDDLENSLWNAHCVVGPICNNANKSRNG